MPFGTGHPLLAANAPLSKLELIIDGGEDEAGLAAARLERMGYTDLFVIEGGAPAWTQAGLELFPELEVPTKGFGETDLLSPRDDFWLASSERPGYQRQNVQDYLDWETTLLEDIERGGPSRYQNLIWS